MVREREERQMSRMNILEKVKRVKDELKRQITGKEIFKANFTDEFKEDFKKVPKEDRKEIVETIQEILKDPYRGELLEDEEDY